MANSYFLRSRKSEDEARRIIRYFADEFTETAAAQEIWLTEKSLEQNELSETDTAKKIDLIRRSVNTHFLKIRRAIYNSDRRRLSAHLKELPLDRKYLLSNIQSNEYDSNSKKRFPVIIIMFNDGQLITDVIFSISTPIPLEFIENIKNSYTKKEIFAYCFMDSKFNLINAASWYSQWSSQHRNKKSISLFQSSSQARLKAFFGLSPATFLLHLKESQWRFNNLSVKEIKSKKSGKDLYRKLLKLLRNNPI